MRALLALLMGCAPTKKTAPDSDASTEPAEGAQQDIAKPAKRGAGTVPQAVKQATAVDEDAQRIEGGSGGGGGGGAKLTATAQGTRPHENPNISQQAKDALKAALPNCDVSI